MEGVHCVAGPWFTVHKSANDWQTMDTIWISNGDKTNRALVQGRVFLEQPPEDLASAEAFINDLPATLSAIYPDLALGAGSKVPNLAELDFTYPRHTIPAVSPPESPDPALGSPE